MGGHFPWLDNCIFQYDPNSTNVANLQWAGNSLDCSAIWDGVTTYPTVYDPDVVGQQREVKAGETASGKKEQEPGPAKKQLSKEGQKAPGVAV